jgi:hypothetical protein
MVALKKILRTNFTGLRSSTLAFSSASQVERNLP